MSDDTPRAEDVLEETDPIKALDAFRALSVDEKLATVFADGSIMRYELRLIEGVVDEHEAVAKRQQQIIDALTSFGRRFARIAAVVGVVLLFFAASNFVLNSGSRRVVQRIEECTTPDTDCTRRAQSGSGQLCAVVLLQNDNRIVNGFDPDHDGAVDTIPVPKECQQP